MNDIYREEILDHYRYPRNQKQVAHPDIDIEETNASCGDKIRMQIKLDKAHHIEEVGYHCQGCAISTAVSSMLTELVEHKSLDQLRKLTLEDLYALMGGPVSAGRIKCVGLSLKALQKGIDTYYQHKK